MPGTRDDVQFQILEHLRVLREDMARLHERIGALEARLAEGTPRAPAAERA